MFRQNLKDSYFRWFFFITSKCTMQCEGRKGHINYHVDFELMEALKRKKFDHEFNLPVIRYYLVPMFLNKQLVQNNHSKVFERRT